MTTSISRGYVFAVGFTGIPTVIVLGAYNNVVKLETHDGTFSVFSCSRTLTLGLLSICSSCPVQSISSTWKTAISFNNFNSSTVSFAHRYTGAGYLTAKDMSLLLLSVATKRF